MDISIIVPTRNRCQLLGKLLASLRNLQFQCWDCIVVDDGSTDETSNVVEEFRASGLPVMYLYQEWAKMGAARNLALYRTTADVVAFTDDDCTVDPKWLDEIARSFAVHPQALGVQGRTLTQRLNMTPFTRQIEQLAGGPPYRTCNIAYRTQNLKDLGGFDTNLIRGEDVVMGMKVLERGPIVFAPDAVVVHPPRPKEWADRKAWKVLLESELHFRRNYSTYASARSRTLSVQKAEHVLSRWVLLPIRNYWRWHLWYFRQHPHEYVRHIPAILREKIALISLLPFFLRQWRKVSGMKK